MPTSSSFCVRAFPTSAEPEITAEESAVRNLWRISGSVARRTWSKQVKRPVEVVFVYIGHDREVLVPHLLVRA